MSESPNQSKKRRRRSPSLFSSTGDSPGREKRALSPARGDRSFTPPQVITPIETTSNASAGVSGSFMPNVNFTASTALIPEFNPVSSSIVTWLEIVDNFATLYHWNDTTTNFQALSKLRGTAQIWYDTIIKRDIGWSQYSWAHWKSLLTKTFVAKRNIHKLLTELLKHKPKPGDCLYEFHFKHLSKIESLDINFTEQDKITLIIGNIDDSNISSVVEAANINDLTVLSNYLRNKTYTPIIESRDVIFKRSRNFISNRVSHTAPFTQNEPINQVRNQANMNMNCLACGQTSHMRNDCPNKHKICRFCNKKGHIQAACFGRRKILDKRVNLISSQRKQKFYKTISVDSNSCTAFIDLGSDCSLIQKEIVQKFKLKILHLEKEVSLTGFLGTGTTVTEYIKAHVQVDEAKLFCKLYVLDDSSFSHAVLIGRNFSEHQSLFYYRINDRLFFKSKQTLENSNFQLDHDPLSSADHSALYDLLTDFTSCVSTDLNTLGKVHSVSLQINLITDKPVAFRPYRISEKDKEILRKIITDLLNANIIRRSTSPFASPVMLVDKKGGEKRMVVNYTALNKLTIKDKFPMPIIDDLVDKLANAKYFTSLDLASSYYQIPIHPESISKTAVITPEGHFEFLRCPFGLCNAPSVFQKMMTEIFEPLRPLNIIIYLDDVLIPSVTIEEGLFKLRSVLSILREYGLTLRLSKCSFLKTTITFLGYQISYNKIMPNILKTEAVRNFPTIKTVHQLRQFLGLVGYFRKFIPSFASKASLLTNLLKKSTQWEWTPQHSEIVELLKTLITSSPVLAIYNPNLECIIYTDASRDGLAGIFCQRTDTGEKPIAYYSKATTKEQKNYHSFELELLAIVYTLNRFRHYLIGNHFKVLTDCNAVKNALSKQALVPRIARWVLSLQDFHFETIHRPGNVMKHVDALSRNPIAAACTSSDFDSDIETSPPLNFGDTNESLVLDDEVTEDVLLISEDDWLLHAQSQDPDIEKIKDILLSGDIANNKAIFKDYDLRGNKVYRLTEFGRRWVVPKKCRWQVVKLNHDDVGHFAVAKTLQRLRQRYWFPKMRRFVTKYIRACLPCLFHKTRAGKQPGFLHSIPKYATPFHTLHVDHLGPFMRTTSGNSYLLVMVDAFTKFVIVKAVPDTSAANVINELTATMAIFGNPRRIIADAGKAFTSQAFTTFCDTKGIRLFITAVGMARGNGQVERTNRTLLDALSTTGSSTDTDKWDQKLIQVQQGINSTIHKTTNQTPAELLLGIKLRTDGDFCDEDSESIVDVTNIRADAFHSLEENRQRQNAYFNRKRCSPNLFKVGDLVLTRISSHSANDGNSKKLLPKFRGPFTVVEVLPNDRYRVKEDIHTTRSRIPYDAVVAVENMKLFQYLRR